ncbi:MAG: outer membrane beta-barrel protein [Flavobacteriales bacterium]|nr:outer membrane beta-barrel protein [Flavobacteriales bacterium]
MKYHILLLLACFTMWSVPQIAIGQSDSASNSSLEIVINAYPVFNSLVADQQFKSEIDVNGAFGFGSDVSLALNKGPWRIELGIGYGNIKLGHKQRGLIFGSDIDPSIGIISTSTIDYDIDIGVLSVPFEVGYTLFRESFGLVVSPGLSWNYVLANNSNVIINYGNGQSAPSNSTLDLGTSMIAVTLGAGKQFSLKDRLNLVIEPKMNYYLRDHFVSNSKILSFALQYGLSYRLN